MSAPPPANPLSAAEIRRRFIEFFVERDHTHVASSPIVPPDDPTLLFTTAGMVQFKALYSGAVALPYARAASVQKCLRAGGKGSDLENVGRTLRHHTFFEMLGNFSFGDYFKEEAIVWAWEFCSERIGLPAERLWPTIYGVRREDGSWDYDEQADRIWREKTGAVNVITRLNEKENFWGPAGETGACGPCSELCFFMGSDEELRQWREWSRSDDPAVSGRIAEGIVEQGDLFLEIWNLVFPQFDQQRDGSRLPLKNRGIDTGAGLERMTTAVQFVRSGGAVNSPYETDLIHPMVAAVAEVAGLPYPRIAGGEAAAATLQEQGLDPATVRLAMNACADHARALTFALSEGIVPSNEGRGYVLRRILRRAARFGKKIGISDPFLWRLVAPVVAVMGEAYPEVRRGTEVIEKTIRGEEERFSRTLNQGSEILEEMLAELPEGGTLSGENAYRLYDTYGFPLDLTLEAADERGMNVDLKGFESCLAEGKARARTSWKGGAGTGRWDELLADLGAAAATEFTGYTLEQGPARVLAAIRDDARVDDLQPGQSAVLVLDRTPFYAEAGGQIGDRGRLTDTDGTLLFSVEDTQKTASGCCLHFGTAEAALAVGAEVVAAVDHGRRTSTRANHSATHLMQGALKRVVGEHVTQQGSFVGPEGLRFDFTNPEPVDDLTLRAIEEVVNEQVRANHAVETAEMSLEDARRSGAIAPFGEKYGARVRVVRMGGFSSEFCGGTHVRATGDIGLFVITGESSVAAGIRRIEACTGAGAIEHINRQRELLSGLSRRLSAAPESLAERVAQLQDEIKALRRQMQEVRAEQARAEMSRLADAGEPIAEGVKLITHRIDGAGHQELAAAWDTLKAKLGGGAVGVFCGVADGKVNLVVGVTDDLAPKRLKAGDIMMEAAGRLGGKGGGKPNLARGGGSRPEDLDALMAELPEMVRGLLK